MAATKFSNGTVSQSVDIYNGRSVQDLFDDDNFAEFFSLNGEENVEVNGETVDSFYTVQAGDVVRFNRADGTKGLVA